MPTSKQTCPVCKVLSDQNIEPNVNRANIACPRCGHFIITAEAIIELRVWTDQQRINLSGWIRENQNHLITQPDLGRLGNLRTPSVGEKADKLLLWLSKQHPKPGAKFRIILPGATVGSLASQSNATLEGYISNEFLGRSWSEDFQELIYLFEEYLHQETGYLEGPQRFGPGNFRITPKGWAYLDSLRKGNPQSNTGFIAMSFNVSLDDAWAAMGKGISDAGYKPLRADEKQHNNKIDDEMIAAIRSSKFLVADLTGHSEGVYYEAGFAQGLGMEVIWLCRRSDEKGRHVDIQQYNCIFWEPDKLEKLTKALKDRIKARFGHGPLNESAVA